MAHATIRCTHKIGDETYAAPDGATLAVDILAQQPNTLAIVIDDYAAEVPLSDGDQWQTVALQPQDFRDAGGDPLSGWKSIRRLRLTPEERLKPKRGGEGTPKRIGKSWSGPKPHFRNLRWRLTNASNE